MHGKYLITQRQMDGIKLTEVVIIKLEMSSFGEKIMTERHIADPDMLELYIR